MRDEYRTEKLAGSELSNLMFQASAQAKGGVLLHGAEGDGKLVRANAIALHTKPVPPEQLPFTTPDDD